MLMAAPGPALLLDGAGIIVAINPAFAALSGQTGVALMGAAPDFILLKTAVGAPVLLRERLADAPEPAGHAGYLLMPHSLPRPVSLMLTPIGAGPGAWAGHLVQVVDAGEETGAPRQTLVRLVQAVSRRRAAGDIFEDLQPHLTALFGACACALYWREEGMLSLLAAHGFGADAPGPPPLIGDSDRHAAPALWSTASGATALPPPLDALQSGSLMALPLEQEKERFGLLLLVHPDPAAFTAAALALLSALAQPLGDGFARARGQEQARREQRDWAAAAQSLPDCLLVLDDEGRVIRLNETAAKEFGWSAARCAGQKLMSLPVAALLPADRILRLVRAGDDELHEWRLPAGRMAQARHTRLPAAAGARARHLISVRDATALYRHEDEQNEQRQMAELGRLVAGVAHEVRNPLFSITATLDSLRRTLPENSAARRTLPLLESQTARLIRLMEDLLHYSRPVALQLESGPIEPVLEEATRQIRRKVLEKGAELSLRVTGRLPPIACDRPRMMEAILNLIDNALSHLSAGGKIWMEAHVVESGVRIAVRDNGPGIPPEQRERVFEPFFTTRTGGTGLGLPIVRRIIAAHGGTITLREDYTRGACFDILLPQAGKVISE